MGQQSITPPSRLSAPLWVAVLLSLFLPGSLVHSQTPANTLPLILPSAIVFDAQGNLYIAETGNHIIRRVDTAGNITAVAGNGTQGFSGDNGQAMAAELDSPQGLALDGNQALYIADTHNHRIRKLDLTTGLITTIAGTTAGFAGDNGLAVSARLNLPTSLAVDANHNLYIADTENHRVRRIAPNGVITTIAGNGIQGFSGDNGAATAASIDSPTGMAVNSAGDLFLSDTHNQRIRKITGSTGIITTIAGTGTPVTLAFPHGLSIDGAGNLYIADTENHRIRRIDAVSGAVTTMAGGGIQTFSGDSGPASAAMLDSPRNVALSSASLLTLADTGNGRIRQLDAQSAPTIRTIAGLSPASGSTVVLAASPTIMYGTGQLTATVASRSATGSVTFSQVDAVTGTTAVLGSTTLTANTAVYETSALPVGSYLLVASYSGDSTHAAAQSLPLFLRITPRQLITIANPLTLLYGQPIPSLNGTISGLLAQDDGSVAVSFTAPATAASPAGVYPISASIAGTSAKNYSVSAVPANLTINPAPTVTTMTPSAASISSGAPLTLTTHIVSTTAGIPSGPVSLMDGATAVLSLTASAGNATFVTSNLGPGSHMLSTSYTGDKNFLPSTSGPTLITIIPAPPSPDFSLAPTGATSQTISSGGTANFNFAVQIQNGALSSPITLAATGLPAFATASFNPAYLAPGTTPGTFALTIDTAQTTALDGTHGNKSLLLALLLFPVAGIAIRRRSCGVLKMRFAFIAMAGLLVFSGCGSRINTGDPTIHPIKDYTITVTGTATSPTGGVLQHSATVKLLVQSAN